MRLAALYRQSKFSAVGIASPPQIATATTIAAISDGAVAFQRYQVPGMRTAVNAPSLSLTLASLIPR